MFARVGIAQDKPGKIDEAAKIYRDSVVPAQKKQKGFKSSLFLTDRHTGKSISISLWESEAELEKTMADGFYQEQVEKFSKFFEGQPVWEHYEVSVEG